MATWLEKQRDKERREAENTRLTKLAVGLDIPSGNPFGRWAQGVAQRTMHPLEALAGAAQQAISDPTATALDWSNPIGGSLSGLVGMFAGKGAKTANLAALVKAEKMAKKGVPDAQIWKQTGWTLDTPDKMPRFEIPDNAATVTPFDKLKSWGSAEDLRRGNSTTGAVSDFMQHPELAKNYDGMMDFGNADKRITMRVVPGKQGASFNEGEMTGFGATGQDITIGTEGNVINQSNALHELQHAIQQREGFARGGSPETALKDYLSLLGADPKTYTQREWASIQGNAFKDYQRLAGEAEARLTQARMNMTPEQRLAQYPYQPDYFQKETGVPLKDLIVRKDGGTAMSVPAKIKVFHGSENEFDVFDPSKAKTAQHIYTTENAGDAGQYGKVSQYEASAKNPVDLSGEMTGKQINDLEDAARNAGLIDENMPFNDWYEQVFQNGQMYQYYGNQSAQNALMSEMYAKGYDAVKIPDAGFGGAMSSSWVFEDPSILKRVKAAPKTEFELAHEVAQRNAALPVDQGGLGLPAGNTAMDRAKAMGFDTPAYRGTTNIYQETLGHPDIAGGATFYSSNPKVANFYATGEGSDFGGLPGANEFGQKTWSDIHGRPFTEDEFNQQGGRVIPALINQSNANIMELGNNNGWWKVTGLNGKGNINQRASDVKSSGKDVMIVKNIAEAPNLIGDTFAVINPSSVRSRFAAFDPMQRNSANILAGGAAGVIGLSTLADLLYQDQYQ